ncbi:MAG: Gfo/Idh/MocA family protein [Armatimonadota bacterium]
MERMPDVRLAAVCDDDADALSAVSRWKAADERTRLYTDWREMLDGERLHIVAECGVDGTRAEILVECARRRLHIISEKPLAMTLDELRALRRGVAESGVRLSMLLTMRFEPAYRAMREAIRGGRIGEVVLATMQKSYRLGNRPQWQRDRRTFSGIIPFIGIHALDLIRWTTGREFVQAVAYQSNAAHPELGDMEDNATIALKFDNRGSASARLDYCRPAAAPTHGDDRLRVAGSEGVIESLACGSEVVLTTAAEGPRTLPLGEARQQFVDFVRTLQAGEPSQVPAEDCFRMTEICLKIRDAANTGRAVSL